MRISDWSSDVCSSDLDGKVNVAEYVQYMSRGFERMDANGDGVLETDELPGRRGEPIALPAFQDNLRRQFHRLDRNHAGKIGRASGRERVCQYVLISVVAVSLKQKITDNTAQQM